MPLVCLGVEAAVLVDLALLDLFDDFDFFVAIIPPYDNICLIISHVRA